MRDRLERGKAVRGRKRYWRGSSSGGEAVRGRKRYGRRTCAQEERVFGRKSMRMGVLARGRGVRGGEVCEGCWHTDISSRTAATVPISSDGGAHPHRRRHRNNNSDDVEVCHAHTWRSVMIN